MSHIMISYQWDSKPYARKIAQILKNHNIPIWMDEEGGISSGDINTAMAEGVQNALAIVCLVSEKYEKSKNCKKELTYSDVRNKIIFPCMVDKKKDGEDYNGDNWLGLLIAGLLWTDFRDIDVENAGKKLVKQITEQVNFKPKELSKEEIFNKNFKGRVFHCISGKENDPGHTDQFLYLNSIEQCWVLNFFESNC